MLAALLVATRSSISDVVSQAQAGGLSVRIESVQWLPVDMSEDMPLDASEGMPPDAMSDMPAPGQQRLQVRLTLVNDSDDLRDFGPGDFSLRSSSGEAWWPMGSNLVEGTLGPGQALSGAVSFEVPVAESGLSLVLTRGDGRAEIPLDGLLIQDRGSEDE